MAIDNSLLIGHDYNQQAKRLHVIQNLDWFANKPFTKRPPSHLVRRRPN